MGEGLQRARATAKRSRRKSATKAEVLELMAAGWELGKRHGYAASVWLQKGGIGRGGEARDVHAATFKSLYKAGLIEVVPGQPPFANPTIWRLRRRDEATA